MVSISTVVSISIISAAAAVDLCPVDEMPLSWVSPCQDGSLLYSAAPADSFKPEVGNGFLATVVGSSTLYVGGLFNGDALGSSPSGVSHRAPVPRWIVAPDGRGGNASGVRTGLGLDLMNAVFRQVSALAGGDVLCEEAWYAPLHAPTLLVHDLVFTNLRPGEGTRAVALVSSEGSSDDLDYAAVPIAELPTGVRAIRGRNRVPELDGGEFTSFFSATNVLPDVVELPGSSNPVVLRSLQVTTTSLNSTDVAADALALLAAAMEMGSDALLREHSRAWAARWTHGSMSFEGDAKLNAVVLSSLYYLRSSIRSDWDFGLSPGGLASNGYNGHTFWDMETWMFPALVFLDPGSARGAMRYRLARLTQAFDKARTCSSAADDAQTSSWCPPGYAPPPEAAMFPWESATSGAEVQNSNGSIGPWGRYEAHISGDIAFAARQYYYASGDLQWLRAVGFPIVNATASFYSARATARAGNASAFDLENVMPPDEYNWPVNNSVYTNAIAKINLEFAYEAASDLGYTPVEDFLAKARGLSIACKQSVPSFPDLNGGYHPEFEGYPLQGRGALVKQADAILLGFPLGVEMDPKTLSNDLIYYANATDVHGPAMTWSMFAIGFFSVGNSLGALSYFGSSYEAYVKPPFNVWSETPTGGTTNFLTGAGGFLQAVLFGAEKLVLHSVHFRGSRLRVNITKDAHSYELLGAVGGAPALTIGRAGGTPVPLAPGGAAVVFDFTRGDEDAVPVVVVPADKMASFAGGE